MGEGEDGGMKRWLAFLPFLALAWALELRVTASLVVDLFPQAVVVERVRLERLVTIQVIQGVAETV
mgnify:CR=1 FL=1